MAAIEKLKDFICEDPRLEVILDRYNAHFQARLVDPQLHSDLETAFLELIFQYFDTPASLNIEKLKSFPLDIILSYLKNTHTYYLEKRLLEIELSIDRVRQKYGDDYPVLHTVKLFWSKFGSDLKDHIKEEEHKLFPLAEVLMLKSQQQCPQRKVYSFPDLGLLNDILKEHEDDELERGITLFMEYITHSHPDLKKVLSFNVLALQLETFLHDLEIHRRVEEEVLIPRLTEMLWSE
ncbi:MAG: hypothetical protein AAF824_04005 [Bacteroidota bacterium]